MPRAVPEAPFDWQYCTPYAYKGLRLVPDGHDSLEQSMTPLANSTFAHRQGPSEPGQPYSAPRVTRDWMHLRCLRGRGVNYEL